MLVMSIPFALLAWNSSYIAGVYSSGAFRAVIPGPLYWLFVLHFLVMGWYGLIRMLSRYRTSNVSQRNKLKYLFLGYGTALCGGAEHFAAGYIRREIVPHDLFIIAFVFIVAYAILMHRLMDITVIIRKTLVYSLVMGILTATYLVIVALFARFFEGLTGYQTVYSSAVAAVLITLCFQPLRRRIQSFVDRKFFRQYVDREEKLYELSREVITHTTPEAMGGALMHVLNETLHPKGGALFLRSRDGSGFVRVSDIGTVVLPARMEEDNELAQYFKDHPKPFVQDMSEAIGRSESTRLKEEREDAA
jgi:hypothetical protein